MMRTLCKIALIAVAVNGCTRSDMPKTDSVVHKESTVLKVKVFADGTITANERPVGLDELAHQLASLK
jgi:biopolymer transport protein ExbD